MRFFRSRSGQIVIPAMLMFPTLFLFVYLIYETAKLSREKIRHQFAMDAAAFVEMTNYSDFLNRTAYVNGAFPMRIFEEGYYDFKAECEGKVQNCNQKTYASILFANGAFPHLNGAYVDGHAPEGQGAFSPLTSWTIEYGGAGAFKNVAWPPPGQPSGPDGAWDLFTLDNADNYWHPYDLATEIYKLYVQIYSLLGSVEDAQFKVLQRLTTQGSTQHSFMQKSYWLNTGDPVGDAAGLATNFSTALGNFEGSVAPYCQQQLVYWGNKHLNGGIQPYVPQKTTPIVNLTQTGGAGCESVGGGLFQVEYADPKEIDLMKKGLELQMNWSIPNQNYFHVDFVTLMNQRFPQGTLHTTISLQGDPAQQPAVWPDPTPKFQVRQFP
jgi:hypothetical protein